MLRRPRRSLDSSARQSGGATLRDDDAVRAGGIGSADERTQVVGIFHAIDHTSLARDYALAAEANDPLLHDWLGEPVQPARVIELTDPNANPWQNGAALFTPLREAPTANLQLLLLPAQVAARFHSPHPWIED